LWDFKWRRKEKYRDIHSVYTWIDYTFWGHICFIHLYLLVTFLFWSGKKYRRRSRWNRARFQKTTLTELARRNRPLIRVESASTSHWDDNRWANINDYRLSVQYSLDRLRFLSVQFSIKIERVSTLKRYRYDWSVIEYMKLHENKEFNKLERYFERETQSTKL